MWFRSFSQVEKAGNDDKTTLKLTIDSLTTRAKNLLCCEKSRSSVAMTHLMSKCHLALFPTSHHVLLSPGGI